MKLIQYYLVTQLPHTKYTRIDSKNSRHNLVTILVADVLQPRSSDKLVHLQRLHVKHYIKLWILYLV